MTIEFTKSADANQPQTDQRETVLGSGAVIHVTPLVHMHSMIEQTGARYLITTINRLMIPDTPAGIRGENHLRLGFNDIVAPLAGMTPPSPLHIEALIGFAEHWRHDGPLVIHCLAGISRSTAAAFVVLCTLNPDCPEPVIASAIRKASETADPNMRMVRLADDVLGRGGRMIKAMEGIGPPARGVDSAQPFSVASIPVRDVLA